MLTAPLSLRPAVPAAPNRITASPAIPRLLALLLAGSWVTAGGTEPPRGTDRRIELAEDSVYTFSAEDFGFSDPDDAPPNRFTRIKLTQAPSAGLLSIDGTPAVSGEFISMLPVHGAWKFPDMSLIWTGVAMSADGRKLAGLGPSGFIYTSTDEGKSWTARGENRGWSSIASSADGSRLVASVSSGKVYVSSDAGATWTPGMSDQGWRKVASSADGNILAAVGWDTGIHVSLDGGATWRNRTGLANWNGLAMSADGVRIAATSYNQPLRISTDSGATWQSRGPVQAWIGSLTCSHDGSRWIAGAGNAILVSTDFGATWTPQAWGAPENAAIDLASSADGSTLIAGALDGIYASYDYGTTWARSSNIGRTGTVAVSSDGAFISAIHTPASVSGNLLTSRKAVPILAFTPETNASGSPYSRFHFQVEDDGDPDRNLDPVERTFELVVAPENDPPTVVSLLPEQTALKDNSFLFQLPASTFIDPDGATEFTYTATRADGGPLPTWLVFDPATRVFSGTPSSADKGLLEMMVTAADTSIPPLSATTRLRVTVPHEAPTGADQRVTINEDTPLALGPSAFGFSDPNDSPPNTFSRVKLLSLPNRGSLTIDGRTTVEGDIVSFAPDLPGIWTQRETKRQWREIALSADGKTLVAAVLNGNLHVSSDFGETWTAREAARPWSSVACSADGSTMVAAATNDLLFVSVDAGATWTPRDRARPWTKVIVSANGSRLMASDSEGWLVMSSDSGTTWYVNPNRRHLKKIACSADGLRLIAFNDQQELLTSSDFGATWIVRDQPRFWNDVASTADGTRLIASFYNGPLMLSEDAGAHWDPLPAVQASRIVASANGQRIVATREDGSLMISHDGGHSWSSRYRNDYWGKFVISGDGKRFATIAKEFIHTATEAIPKLVYTPSLGGFGSPFASFRFQVGDDGAGEATFDLSPKTFTIDVLSVNDAPVPTIPISAKTATELVPFSYKFPGGPFDSVHFSDDGGARSMSYRMTLADGSPLPAWLQFDPATQMLAGIPGHRDSGMLDIRVIATDADTPPLSAYWDFLLRVDNVAENPLGAAGSAVMSPDTTYTFAPEDFGFSDPRDFPPHRFTRVKLSSLPAAGTLTLEGSPAVTGDFAVIQPLPAGIEWIERESVRPWKAITMSTDGARQVAVASGSPILVSNDFGATWAPRESIRDWRTVASSADGTKLFAGGAIGLSTTGFLYTSDDAGATWSLRDDTRIWAAIASSADGMKLAAVASGQLLTSADSGTTWIRRFPNLPGWGTIASSADGMTLIATRATISTRLWISHDGGETWSESGQSFEWLKVALSADGTRIYAVAKAGGLFVSMDGGLTWSQRERRREWSALAVSPDGLHVVAAVDKGPLYLSPDAGRTWHARGTSQRWSGVASSAHGSHFAAVASDSRILTSETVPASVLAFTPAPGTTGVPYASFTFQVEDAGPIGTNLDPIPKTFSLDVGPDLPTPFALWATQQRLPVDPASNGGAHLLAFAFGLEPNQLPGPSIAIDGDSITHRGTPDLVSLPASAGSGYGALFGRRKSSGLTCRV